MVCRLRSCLLIAFCFLLGMCSPRPTKKGPNEYFLKRETTASNTVRMPYRLLYPEPYEETKKYPLVLFLHGAGERGTDNTKQLSYVADVFLKEENRKKFPCFVILPQCPEQGYWASVNPDRSKLPLGLDFNYDRPITPWLEAALEIADNVTKKEQVDTSRVYIMGLSMGGMATFESVYRHPRRFAAAVPICGGGDAERYDERVKHIPFWVFHGDEDNVVEVENSIAMVAKLRALGADVTYTQYPGIKHDSWINALAEPDLMPWLFSHRAEK